MVEHDLSPDALEALIEQGAITHGGHRQHRIYGRVDCRAERRYTAPVNRVYFRSAAEARAAGFRPCSACLKDAYRTWRAARLAERQRAAGQLLAFPSLTPLAA